MMAETVVAVFDHHAQAVRGVEELQAAGFSRDQVSIIAPDIKEAEAYADELGVRVVQAGAAGVAAGGLIGGLGGWLVGLTGLAIPGIGLFLAAGPVAAALVGAISGMSVGGLVGMLAGLGLPHHAAEEYSHELHQGRTLVFVHAGDRYEAASAALSPLHPRAVHHYEERIGHGREGAPAPDAVSGTARVSDAPEGSS